MAHNHYMLRRTNCKSAALSLRRRNKDRKRLQKPFPDHHTCERFYACKEASAMKSCENLVSEDGDSSYYGSSINQEGDEPLSYIGYLLKSRTSSFIDEPVRYSTISKRTRAKTPVFTVGQLEHKLTLEAAEDRAQLLAEDYRSILPRRVATPFTAPLVIKSTPKALRKVKSLKSLRDVAKDQSETRYSWNSNTLVGSPTSPTYSDVKNESLSYQPSTVQNEEFPNSVSEMEEKIGLWICMDLLTNELASAFFRKHPEENEDRASNLQILLMVEACEALQRQIRQKLHCCRVTGKDEDSMQEADEILEHWLQVLYSVYDLSEHSDFSNSASDEK